MIDLNDVFVPAARHDLTAIKAQLAATARDWLPPPFPEARLTHDKRAMRCADLSGRRSRGEGSCVIHLDGPYAGWGFDFATGERAGPIDMIYHATGMSEGRLFDEAARLAHLERDLPTRPAAPVRPDHSLEIRRIQDECVPLAGRLAETYLQSRGLSDPHTPDLLFHPDLTDYNSRRGWPGMVAIPRLANGDPVGGIHRTFLMDDGSGKAPAGKKMLGTIAEAAVRLFRCPETAIWVWQRGSRRRSRRRHYSEHLCGRPCRLTAWHGSNGLRAYAASRSLLMLARWGVRRPPHCQTG